VHDHRDTIFALSSGQPPAAIAVVRISGPRAGAALEQLIGRLPKPRMAALAQIHDPQHGDIIDEALVLWFPGPNSETGEDVAELQLHGGRAVIAATLAALGGMDGLRLAEGGEFTRRAFENGKIDLTRVEGLADLIAAETQAQRRQAFGQARGGLSQQAERWRAELTRALALVDAGIDFSDEGDVPADVAAPARKIVASLAAQIGAALADGRCGERVRDGLVVAITGKPNVGKSTLLNRLARREAAIVSPYAGTTRDVIEVHLDLGGYAVTLLDTAGMRASDDPVELEGIRRAQERAKNVDLVLWLTDSDNEEQFNTWSSEVPFWIIRTKIDIVPAKDEDHKYKFTISSKSDINIQSLIDALSQFAVGHAGRAEPALVTRQRQRTELERGLSALNRALEAGAEEIVAEELRGAATALGRLTGRIDVEDVLDVIFRDFCIGK
jgi:tRNA modification GTPase